MPQDNCVGRDVREVSGFTLIAGCAPKRTMRIAGYGDSTMRSLSYFVCFAFLILAPLAARAEFILDDFDDPAMVTSPESDQYVVTTKVGPLNATRQIRIFWSQGDADGQLDANISWPSVLTGQVSRLNPRNQFSSPIVSLQFEYVFDSTDFTEDGINNATLFDFHRLESEIPPSQFRTNVNEWYHSRMPGPRSSDPFTLSIPFDSLFFTRSGLLDRPDFEHVQVLGISIRVSELTGGGPDPLNFLMQLERIRIGRIVPEPTAWRLSVIGMSLAAMKSSRIRRHRTGPEVC